MPHFTPDLANPHSRGWSGGCHSPWRNSRGWLAIGVILLGILYDPKASAFFGLTRYGGLCLLGGPRPTLHGFSICAAYIFRIARSQHSMLI
ncbi:hypothetical protein [uncultured Cardiobacterium sp.]|uniref:hypothetical protein n=1 Tax=uncultured Cardiobacterium sp. TaxID=417619 RepID=UPI0026231D5F|nr:hypothetical protein [uncultured Cardiobacterium sp.]